VEGYADIVRQREQTPAATAPTPAHNGMIGVASDAVPLYAGDPASQQNHTFADFTRSNFSDGISITDEAGNVRKLEDIEAEMIRLAIDKYKGHMTEVARRLGIGRSTLYRKVRDMGLEVREG